MKNTALKMVESQLRGKIEDRLEGRDIQKMVGNFFQDVMEVMMEEIGYPEPMRTANQDELGDLFYDLVGQELSRIYFNLSSEDKENYKDF